jgi:hypothetical protein
VFSKKETLLWVSLLLGVRVLSWAGLNGGDDAGYLALARDIRMETLPDAFATPQGGRVVWLGWLALCQTGKAGLASGWVSLPPYLLIAWLVARWGRALGGVPLARAALLVLSVHPHLGHYATLAYAEMLCAALLLLSASLLLLPDWAGRRGFTLAAGALGALACLTHELAAAPLALLALMALPRTRKAIPFLCGALAVGVADIALMAWATGDPLARLHRAIEVTSAGHRAWHPDTGTVLRRISLDWWAPMLWPPSRDFVLDGGATILALWGLWTCRRGEPPLLRFLGLWWLLALVALDLLPSSIVPYLPALDAEDPRMRVPATAPSVLLGAWALVRLRALRGGAWLAGGAVAASLACCLLAGVDARIKTSVARQAASEIRRQGDAATPIWTDPYTALILRPLLPSSAARAVDILPQAFAPGEARGTVLWDPAKWRIVRDHGREIPPEPRGEALEIARFAQVRRPRLRELLGFGASTGKTGNETAVLYTLSGNPP